MQSLAHPNEAVPTLDSATLRSLDTYLRRYAARRVPTTEIANDLVQETWVAAMGALPSFSGRSSFKTWLTSILRRKIADSYRSRRPSVAFAEEQHHPGGGDSLYRLVEARQQTQILKAALSELTPREREAVELCAIDDLSRDEAAERMGLSRPCLRVTLCRGRKHLRDVMDTSAEETPVAA